MTIIPETPPSDESQPRIIPETPSPVSEGSTVVATCGYVSTNNRRYVRGLATTALVRCILNRAHLNVSAAASAVVAVAVAAQNEIKSRWSTAARGNMLTFVKAIIHRN